ncbi:hypothetical protein ScPMuIL_004482 [Solemya velum]
MGTRPAVDGCGKAYEKILSQSGQFGFFQKRLFLISGVLQAFTTSVIACTPLIVRQGDHTTDCQTTGADDGLYWTNHSTDLNDLGTDNTTSFAQEERCKIMTQETVMGLDLPQWFMQSNDEPMSFMIVCIQALSVILGTLIGGFLADHLGRRRIFFASFGLMAAAQCLSTVSDYWQLFLGLRCLSLSSAGCFLVTSLVLPQEYTGLFWRDVCACLSLWPIGMIILACEAYLIKQWHLLVVANGSACLPFLGTFFIIPESPRWFLAIGKFTDSEAAVKEMISCNARTVTDVTSLFDRMQRTVMKFTHPRRHTYIDLFRTRAFAKSSFVLAFMWLVCSTVYTGLYDKVSVLTGNSYLNMFLPFLIDVPIISSAVIINKCVGRRWTIFLYATSSGFVLICVLLLHVTSNLTMVGELITGLALFGKLGVASALCLICLMTLEIYPTVMRSMGCALGLSFGVIGTVVAPQISQLTSGHYTTSFVTFGLMMILIGFAVLALPETSNKPLSDINYCRHRIIQTQPVRYLNAWNVT